MNARMYERVTDRFHRVFDETARLLLAPDR
jgi:hypothetical protein